MSCVVTLVMVDASVRSFGLAKNCYSDAEYTKEMQRFTHTSRGFALLMGIVISFSLVSKFIFVDLWHWRETRRGRKKTRSV